MKSIIHILIAEPNSIVFEGLTGILMKWKINSFISRALSLEDVLQLHLKRKCDIIIINPGLIQNKIKIFENIKKQMEDTFWMGIIYSYYGEELTGIFDEMITITDGPENIFEKLQNTINHEPERENEKSKDQLSERELEVLKLLASGLANKEIAEKLNISVNTVISHRKNISRKTGIKSVSGLTIYAVVQKFLKIDNLH